MLTWSNVDFTWILNCYMYMQLFFISGFCRNYHMANRTNENGTSVNVAMVTMDGVLPLYGVVLYFFFAFLAMVVCLVSLVAIKRTKKTPYSTKVLSIGLLFFHILFLACSSIPKFYKYNDQFILQHIARGLHISSYVIVGSMALERLLVLNWPYIYIRVATKSRTRIIGGGICVVSFLHYVAVRGFACYAKNKFVDCGLGIQAYFLVISILVPILSFISYGKIYGIVRQKTTEQKFKYRLTQYKGTILSFMYLMNTTINLIIYLGLATFYVVRSMKGVKEDGVVAAITDSVNVVNCMADPLMYAVMFKETRLEILKMIEACFPAIQERVRTMHMDIFDITMTTSKTTSINIGAKKGSSFA